MLNKPDGQDLVNAFFTALDLRDLTQCERYLAQLRMLSAEQPDLTPWCTYFDGILANERDNDWAKSEHIFSRLLQADLDSSLRTRVLLALGRTYDYQGRWTEAIAVFEQKLSLSAEAGQPIEQANAWKHMAISYHKGFTRGDFAPPVLQQAIVHCQSALMVLESIAVSSADISWLKGSIWNTLGLIYVSLSRWVEAIDCYQQDLAICQALDDRHGMGLTYGNLGEVYQKQGNSLEALAAYREALAIIREFGNRYEEIEALANLSFLYQEMDQIEPALEHYQQTIQLIEALRSGVSTETAKAGFFATVVDTYANMALLCLAANRPEQAFYIGEQARSRTFLDLLAARVPDLSLKMEAKPLTVTEVQAALPADTLLLEYFTTGLIEAVGGPSTGQPVQRHRFPPAQTWLFAVSRTELRAHDTGLSPNDLRPRHLRSVIERHFLEPNIRQNLYNHLIAPVEDLIQGKRRLFVVPHGPLHYIPFQALLAPDGDTLLRQDGAAIVHAPSATLLFNYRQTEFKQAAENCLALGYNGESDRQLQFAEDEARSIVQLMGGQALVGSQPKKAKLFIQAPNYRLLHFSCHGDFDPDTPLASSLRLSATESLSALDVFEQLHLCCDLVTLSACESGLSRIRRGDELIGLTRAFLYAGTPTLIATLWRVDERSTRFLMEKFYQAIGQGIDFPEALQQAQLEVKHLGDVEAGGQPTSKDPFYWAPFILVTSGEKNVRK